MLAKKLKSSVLVLVTALGIFTIVLLSSPRTLADGGTLADKSKLYGLAQCYESGGFISPVSSTDWMGIDSIIMTMNEYYTYDGTTNRTMAPCARIAGSYNVTPAGGADVSTITTFMHNIGYTSSEIRSGQQCIEYKFTNGDGDKSSAKLCADVDGDGKLASDNLNIGYTGPNGNLPEAIQLKKTSNAGRTYIDVDCKIMDWITGTGNGGCSPVRYIVGETGFNELGQSIYNQISIAISSSDGGISRGKWYFDNGGIIYPDAIQNARNYRRDERSANSVVRTFSSGTYANVAALKLNNSEKLSLLQSNLNGTYIYYTTQDKACGGIMTESEKTAAKNDGFQEVRLSIGGPLCWIKAQNFTDFPGWNNEDYFDGTMFDFARAIEELSQLVGTESDDQQEAKDRCAATARAQYNAAVAERDHATDQNAINKAKEVIQKINDMAGVYWIEGADGSITCKDIPTVAGGTIQGGTTYTPPTVSDTNITGDNSNGFNSDECYDAAGSLGWILCPVMKVVTEATDSIYDDYIQEDFLEVKTDWVETLRPQWGSIRNIANICFIIFFLIVIFSQLTGIGLSNYSIKKSLPRLVAVVVLVNISFLICQLAVDLSNILGYSLNAIFDSLAQGNGSATSGMGSLGDHIMSDVSWVGIAALAYTTRAIWLIPLLLSAISAAVSVLFGALILGIRQAGVLVLIVLAPVAIACYALPNTKSLFDKWAKAFISLLMVFPICGALVGGGNFAASLILSAAGSNVMISVIAMLLRVVPFFFIPSIVKSSLTALGNIGMRVGNLGARVGRGMAGAVGKSDAMKYADANLRAGRADQIERNARRRAKLNEKLRNMRGIGGAVTAIEDSSLGKKIGTSAQGRRNAKLARLYSRSNKLLADEAAAGGSHRIQRGTAEYDAKVEAAHFERINSMTKDIQGQHADIASDLSAIEPMYQQAIQNYESNATDENLAALQAMGNMALDNGDPGRSLYHNMLGWATEGGYEKSVQAMGQHMMRDHVKDLKPVARDTFALSSQAALGNLGKGSFRLGTYVDPLTHKSQEHYVSGVEASKSISGYDASSLLKMDEGAIQRLTIAAANGEIDNTNRGTIDALTSEALSNPRLYAQPKIREQINNLRSVLGLRPVANNFNAPAEGDVLRTGNDDRPRIIMPGDPDFKI